MEPIEAIPHHPEADSFDLRNSWNNVIHAISGHKLLVAATTLLTLSLVVAYIVIWPPVYQAEVILAAEPTTDAKRDDFYQYWDVFRKDHLPDETKLISSGPVLRKVIEELNLTYDDVYHPFLRYATHLWVQSSIGQTYRRIKYSIFPKKTTPYDPTPEEIELSRTLLDLKEGVVLEAYPDTNVGRLVVRGPSPRVAEIANTLVRTYLEERVRRHVAEADKAYDALKNEVDKTRDELAKLEVQMQEYYTANSILLMFEKDKVEISQWLTLKASIVELQAQIAQLSNSLAAVNAQLKGGGREAATTAEGLRQRDNPHANPRNDDVLAQLPFIELAERKSQYETQLRGARAALKVKLAAVNNMEHAMGDLPEKIRISHDMQRQHNILEKKYVVLNEKLMIAAVSRTSALAAPASIRVVEEAAPPEKHILPKTKLLLFLALVMGVTGGGVLAFMVDLVHGRVSRHRLSVAQGVLPVYAIVDQDKAHVRRLFVLPKRLGRFSGEKGG